MICKNNRKNKSNCSSVRHGDDFVNKITLHIANLKGTASREKDMSGVTACEVLRKNISKWPWLLQQIFKYDLRLDKVLLHRHL